MCNEIAFWKEDVAIAIGFQNLWRVKRFDEHLAVLFNQARNQLGTPEGRRVF